jgi:hypothetical protein
MGSGTIFLVPLPAGLPNRSRVMPGNRRSISEISGLLGSPKVGHHRVHFDPPRGRESRRNAGVMFPARVRADCGQRLAGRLDLLHDQRARDRRRPMGVRDRGTLSFLDRLVPSRARHDRQCLSGVFEHEQRYPLSGEPLQRIEGHHAAGTVEGHDRARCGTAAAPAGEERLSPLLLRVVRETVRDHERTTFDPQDGAVTSQDQRLTDLVRSHLPVRCKSKRC